MNQTLLAAARAHGMLHLTSPTISQHLQPLVTIIKTCCCWGLFVLPQALMGLSARPTTGPGDALTATLAFPMAVKVNCSYTVDCLYAPLGTAAQTAQQHPHNRRCAAMHAGRVCGAPTWHDMT